MVATATEEYRTQYHLRGVGRKHAAFRIEESPGTLQYTSLTYRAISNPSVVKTWIDIGSGSGEYALTLLRKLPHARLTYNDISRDQSAMFNRLAHAEKLNVRVAKIICAPFDKIPPARYDLVTSLHSFYGIEDLSKGLAESRLPRFHSFINKGGTGVIIIATRENLLEQLRDKFYERIHGCRGKVCAAEDIKDRLGQLGIPYKKIRFSEKFKTSGWIKDGRLTAVGVNTVEAMTHCTFNRLDKHLQSAIYHFLKTAKRTQKSEAIILRK